ncbi:MAG: ABC transporter ATP-binding protein [Cyclobacteriaceae bacterium]
MINVRSLGFAYKKDDPLFENLTFDLKPGSILGLLGKNGAGKTTLLKTMAGLLFPKSGEVEVMGYTPSKRQASLLQEIYYVPEEFHLPSIAIKTFIKTHAAFYPRFDRELMLKLLGEFELPEDKSLHKMSYGQKKKFLISFALATKSSLLILDEPTNGMDIPSKATFRRVLAGSLEDSQLVVISTHQVKDVENLIDKIMILDSGNVILEKDMLDISAELSFSLSPSNDDPNILYSEIIPGGYKVITEQLNGSSSIDIELLFNAVTQGTQLFKSHDNK